MKPNHDIPLSNSAIKFHQCPSPSARNRVTTLERAESVRHSAERASAAHGHMAPSPPSTVDSDADSTWRTDGVELLNQAADPCQFGWNLGRLLPEAAAACVQSQIPLGKGPVMDRAGKTHHSYTNASFDKFYRLQVHPKVHLASASVGLAIAITLQDIPGTEELVEVLENKNGGGEEQGISDTAGRALLAGTLLLEYKVALDLVGYWTYPHPPLMPVYVRKPIGLGFDKTTLRGKEDKEMLTVLMYYLRGEGDDATVETFQLAMEHIQYVFNADKTRILKGGELEMRTINRTVERMITLQLKLQELGIIDLGPNNGKLLRYTDFRFGGTDHAGECDDAVLLTTEHTRMRLLAPPPTHPPPPLSLLCISELY